MWSRETAEELQEDKRMHAIQDGAERHRIPTEIPKHGPERLQKNYRKTKEWILYKDGAERHRIPAEIPKGGPERRQKNYMKAKECIPYKDSAERHGIPTKIMKVVQRDSRKTTRQQNAYHTTMVQKSDRIPTEILKDSKGGQQNN
jgi:hypothetical protein